MGADPLANAAGRLVRRLNLLGRISDEPGRLTRTFLSPAMARANAQVGEWMRAAGLRVREDRVGNLIGRVGDAGKRTFVVGSHLDTVRDAGRFDGPLGVLLGVAAVEALGAKALAALPRALEVVAFSEEEGVRFASGYLGSKGYVGRLRAADLARRDAQGTTVAEALRPRSRIPAMPRGKKELAGYFEVHIEQGPALEAARQPLGVVTAIAGQTRGIATFTGKAGHAGTTPMRLRRDALAGAAEWVGVVERHAAADRHALLVATNGVMQVAPGAPNVIPGEVRVSLDVRHPNDRSRERALRELLAAARAIARRRHLALRWQVTQADGAVACDRHLAARLRSAVQSAGKAARVLDLVSGAGHDGVVLSQVTPVAMLFVRCRGGLSHHPDEYAAPADIAAALRVSCAFLERVLRE